MASKTATSSQIFQNGFSNQEIEAAIAKTAELRALHAALTRGNSPADSRFPSPSSRPVSQFSAQDYPVFTPSYEDEPVNGYGFSTRNPALSENCNENSASRRSRFSPNLFPPESQVSPAPSQISVPGSEIHKSSRRNNWGNLKSASSCNRSESVPPSIRNPHIVFPMTDSHISFQPKQKSRGSVISWFFPKLKKKHKIQNSPHRRAESEQVSQFYSDLGIVSVETLKRELIEANASRDEALKEVSETKYSLQELKQKLEFLEAYCEELKKSLNQQMNPQFRKKLESFAKIGKSHENLMPFSEEVMVEGFLQIVSEARLSVKQFSQNLMGQIDDKDKILTENLNSLFQPYKLSLNSNSQFSKPVLYHLESIINQTFFQDFENSSFQKNGSPTFLDPAQDRQVKFSSFVALRNLSWNEVQKKGTKFYCERFSKFCDRKMSLIVSELNWTTPWSENLLQGFFIAAKCVWLVHLLAFSFNPALGILRVEESRGFDAKFMEDLFVDRNRAQGFGKVKVMVMPGFYVQDKVLRCEVICGRYKSVA